MMGGKGASAADETLFAMLKDLVKKISKTKSITALCNFPGNLSLEEMAIQYPINMEELTKISGVGAGKATKYGKPFIDLIKAYVEENDIERPSDLVIKSVVNKSGLKVYIIQNVDRKIRLEDMAKSKSLKMNDLITEMETIVESGTKLNIKYYLDDMMDEDKRDEALEYFKESQTDSVEEALKELGENDYSEEEIRLLRIQFISDYAN